MVLNQLSASLQSLSPLLTNKLGPFDTDSHMAVSVYDLEHCGSYHHTSMRLGASPAPSFPTTFHNQSFESFLSCSGTLGCAVCPMSQLFLPVYPQANVGLLGPPATDDSPAQSSSDYLTVNLLCPGCLRLLLLLFGMNISSLIPLLLGFHIVHFLLVLIFIFKLVLSCLWLCEEAKCICLYLHLVWKFRSSSFLVESVGFSMYIIMSSENNEILLRPLQFECLLFLYFLFFLIAVARASSTMLNKIYESGHSCLILDLIDKVFSFCPLNITLAVRFSYITLLS